MHTIILFSDMDKVHWRRIRSYDGSYGGR